ncbi:MAG: hypothetical protein IKY21_03315 [Clostridia bacterium]|nr:hypothetical protein [Clostridia bacterium]
MKRTIRDAIMDARLTDEMINTFIGQIGICSILGGIYFESWIVFGLLLLCPLAVFVFSKRFKWCRFASIILGVIYGCLWVVIGVLIGKIFSVSASVVLGIVFLIPGVAYNWCAINYFLK